MAQGENMIESVRGDLPPGSENMGTTCIFGGRQLQKTAAFYSSSGPCFLLFQHYCT